MFGLLKISTAMKRRMCCILMATLLVTSWVSVTSKPLSPYAAANPQAFYQTPRTQDIPEPALHSTQGTEGMANGYKETSRGLSRLGSIPPRCEHKCGGCVPCDPIQIPTTTATGHLGVQYANYEPEGWKCKCGTSYFNP